MKRFIATLILQRRVGIVETGRSGRNWCGAGRAAHNSHEEYQAWTPPTFVV